MIETQISFEISQKGLNKILGIKFEILVLVSTMREPNMAWAVLFKIYYHFVLFFDLWNIFSRFHVQKEFRISEKC